MLDHADDKLSTEKPLLIKKKITDYSSVISLDSHSINNIKIISENLQRRATSPGGGAGRPDSDHVSRAAGAAFAPGRLGIALPVQEQGAKNMLFFASYSICPLLNPIPLDSVARNCYAMAESPPDASAPSCVPLADRDRPRGATGHPRRSEPAPPAARPAFRPRADH